MVSKLNQILPASFVAKALTLLRPFDIFARIGGEEFVVLVPGVDLKVAEMIAERIRCAVKQMTVVASAAEIRITVGIGVAPFESECADLDSLVKLADERLYRAKSSGRDQVCSGN
jgi:diguanylate cyclase (GGDEF)-like protein